MVKQITRNDALMWLNDRVGTNATVTLSVDRGGWNALLIEMNGELKHAGPGMTAEHGDELTGLYEIRDGRGLDLSEMPDDAFSIRETRRGLEELQVLLADHVGIGVTAR
jgi:hypothetical protein